MEKLIVYPSDEKQAATLKSVLQEMHIDYTTVTENEMGEVEDEALVKAMKETEKEKPLSETAQNDFFNWVKQQA